MGANIFGYNPVGNARQPRPRQKEPPENPSILDSLPQQNCDALTAEYQKMLGEFPMMKGVGEGQTKAEYQEGLVKGVKTQAAVAGVLGKGLDIAKNVVSKIEGAPKKGVGE